jgi:hypothetical protein
LPSALTVPRIERIPRAASESAIARSGAIASRLILSLTLGSPRPTTSSNHAFDNGALDAVELMAHSIDLFLDRLLVNPQPYGGFGAGGGGGRGRGGPGGPGGPGRGGPPGGFRQGGAPGGPGQ